jgi:hypothetical protein
MLSFLTETCEQLAEGAAQEACNWAASNPAIAIGTAAAATLLATTATGLYFCPRKPAAKAPVVPVARLARQTLGQAISEVHVDQSKLVVPAVEAALTERTMPVQSIVLGFLLEQSKGGANQVAAMRLREDRKRNVKETDQKILTALGLPVDGKMPKTAEGQARYDQVMDIIAMPHLKLR